MAGLQEYLRASAQGDLLPWDAHISAAQKFSMTFGQVEEASLELGLLPARYQRNRKTISIDQQLLLFRSRVAVIGLGGLGGYIVEELGRLGVGHITAIDPDVFEEHNLNRQLLSTHTGLGKPKVELAKERLEMINPSVTVTPLREAFTKENGAFILRDIDLAVDALDSIPTRLDLAEVCSAIGIPLVHGTIAGWYGQVTTQYPGDDTLQRIYGNCSEDKGVERMIGNPAFTPAVVASFEVAEVCKVLLRQGTTLRKRLLHINLFEMEIEEIIL